uniref:Uncharacterized protein n=1 Tax=Haemonchus placei TaxID=6290 RepID=A0A158QJR1_HAEPC
LDLPAAFCSSTTRPKHRIRFLRESGLADSIISSGISAIRALTFRSHVISSNSPVSNATTQTRLITPSNISSNRVAGLRKDENDRRPLDG